MLTFLGFGFAIAFGIAAGLMLAIIGITVISVGLDLLSEYIDRKGY